MSVFLRSNREFADSRKSDLTSAGNKDHLDRIKDPFDETKGPIDTDHFSQVWFILQDLG
jgi:hypothetical protein